MEKRISGLVLAVTTTVAVYLVIMAVWVDAGTTPADHAAAKVIGVLGGGVGIVAAFLFARRFFDENPALLPGYVPREGSGDE